MLGIHLFTSYLNIMAPKKSNTTPALPPPPPAGGPGGPLEVVFTFDTTGSMYGCLAEVRKRVQDVITRLFTDIPALRIAVFAHGDYGDAYETEWVDFTNDPRALCQFVQNVKGTGGGDWEECYELVLKQCREQLSWSAGSQRSVVMIGDAIPHAISGKNPYRIDWREETRRLHDEVVSSHF